jgi:3-oxoacyl-[acyl-carrier protein] reductase
MSTAYIFGSTGSIGASISQKFQDSSWELVQFSRLKTQDHLFTVEDLEAPSLEIPKANCVVWANGANLNDSITTYSRDDLHALLEANLFYITDSLKKLLDRNLLSKGSSLVIVSSIWQELSRQNKLSYTVAKSALRGLVHSLAADLGPMGYRVNGVLPGVVDTPMSRKALSTDQIEKFEKATPIGRLVSLGDVANLTFYLAGEGAAGVSGQSIAVDGGWSVVRYV